MGSFIISLDFELFWGVFDIKTIKNYGENVINVHSVLPKILKLAETYEISLTIGFVGLMGFKTKDELLKFIESSSVPYKTKQLCSYTFFRENYQNINERYLLAFDILNKLVNSSHEIGSHTFSHFYCNALGQTPIDFMDDISKFSIVFEKIFKKKPNTIIFPRNQINKEYLEIIKNQNYKTYRGNNVNWIQNLNDKFGESIFIKILRGIDTYINISGFNCNEIIYNELTNVPASRFFRPYNKYLFFFEKLKLLRIKNSMTYAAKKKLSYHLWWHPHNFGENISKNLKQLDEIFNHYLYLNKKYGFTSKTMYSASIK